MKRLVIMTALAASGCTASLVKVEPDDLSVVTIGMKTGRLADEGLYRGSFERGAEAACQGPYQVMERGRDPSTLAGYVKPESDYYWVLSCIDPD